ncbi:MAG: hypothetical protein AAF355_06710 [Myxococcota bacterium]
MVRILLFGVLGSCVEYKEGIVVELNHYVAGDSDESVEEPDTLRIDHSYLVVQSVELLPCENTAQVRHPWLESRYWLSHSKAYAHSEDLPTRIGAPAVIDLKSKKPILGGVFLPPPEHFCKVRVTVGPADWDAVGLPESVELVGRSASVKGRDDTLVFSFSSDESVTFDLTLPEPLNLNRHSREAEVWIQWPSRGHFENINLQNVELSQRTAEPPGTTFLQNAISHTSLGIVLRD